MATYAELFGLFNESALKNRVTAAVVIAAETVMLEEPVTDNHVNRMLWAKQVFSNPRSKGEPLFMAILAANSGLEAAQILAATDEQIQTNVDEHIDLFADGS